MDRIRMFYSNIDTKPRVLINHFVRFLGFYLEGVANKENTVKSNVESMVDIYIISDAYVTERTTIIDVKEEEKTILIYLDGWGSDARQDISVIRYYNGMSDLLFLKKLSGHMLRILAGRADRTKRLFDNAESLRYILNSLTKYYVDNDILQVTLFASCFYAQNSFYTVALTKYLRFISQLELLDTPDHDSDLMKYIRIRARYEVDLICKVNHFEYYFEPVMLQEECEELLRKYVDNETLHILQADIDFKLNGIWNKAGNEYADIRLADCAYAYLKQGNILQNYVRDLKGALNAYRIAVYKKEDYYLAWYRIGECYESQVKYTEAVDAYEKVYMILSGRYYRHVLAPLEIMYLYYAVMRIAMINEIIIKDYDLSEHYRDLADNILGEIAIKNYFQEVWNDDGAYRDYLPLIQEEMKKIIGKRHTNTPKYGGKKVYGDKREKKNQLV